jgi:hypothetical protein
MNKRIQMLGVVAFSFACGAAAMHTGAAAANDGVAQRAETEAVAASAPTTSTLQSVVVRRTSSTSLRIPTSTSTPAFNIEFGNFTSQVPVQKAGTTLNCSGNSFHLTTGTTGGTCTVNSSTGTATCTDGSNSSTAKCVTGCGNSSGAGDCTQN